MGKMSGDAWCQCDKIGDAWYRSLYLSHAKRVKMHDINVKYKFMITFISLQVRSRNILL